MKTVSTKRGKAYDMPSAESEVTQPKYKGYEISWDDCGFVWIGVIEPGEPCLWDYSLAALHEQIDEVTA